MSMVKQERLVGDSYIPVPSKKLGYYSRVLWDDVPQSQRATEADVMASWGATHDPQWGERQLTSFGCRRAVSFGKRNGVNLFLRCHWKPLDTGFCGFHNKVKLCVIIPLTRVRLRRYHCATFAGGGQWSSARIAGIWLYAIGTPVGLMKLRRRLGKLPKSRMFHELDHTPPTLGWLCLTSVTLKSPTKPFLYALLWNWIFQALLTQRHVLGGCGTVGEGHTKGILFGTSCGRNKSALVGENGNKALRRKNTAK